MVSFRRILVIAGRSGEGPLTEPTAGRLSLAAGTAHVCGPPSWCIDSRRFVEFTTYAPASRLEYQAPAELATLAGHNTFVGPRFFDVGRSASDHEFVGDAAYIHLEIEALHRRAREMPRQTLADEIIRRG